MTGKIVLLERLRDILDDGALITDAAELHYLSTDVYRQGATPMAAIRPTSTEQTARAIAEITGAGIAVYPRGGGNSYTAGYVPALPGGVMIDTGGLDRIHEINREDMYVRAGAGVTWAALRKACAGTGLRPAFWGPLSGISSRIGGGISQHSIFFGAGTAGISADSVLSVTAVLADGTILKTGSAGADGVPPFLRHYGPDLTGLFCGDTGAFGVKTEITLRLVPDKPFAGYLSVAYEDPAAMCRAMSAVARLGIATECFGFDPVLQSQRTKRESVMEDVKTAAKVAAGSGGLKAAAKNLVKLGLHGRRFLDDVAWSFHVTTEAFSEAELGSNLALLKGAALGEGGREIPDSIPRMMRAHPFNPLNNMLGPFGERWLPVHGVFPHSRAAAAVAAVADLKAVRAEALDRLKIEIGLLMTTAGVNAFAVEPVLYWPGARNALHDRHVEAAHLAKLNAFPQDPETEAEIAAIRADIIARFTALQATHLQIGRTYPFAATRSPATLDLLTALKRILDPKGLMNPGSLGLD